MASLVTAVMICGKTPQHQDLEQRAIESVLAQTYSEIELLVINDGKYSHAPTQTDSRFREIKVVPGKSLGELRNLGLELARGDWLIQTDGDDWHHPRRIEEQMLRAHPGHCVLLESQIRYSFCNNTAFIYSCGDGIAGTILHPKTDFRYPSKRKGEDSDFWLQAFRSKRILMRNRENEPGPEIYVRFHHGSNTWHEAHIMKGFTGQKDRWELPPETERLLRKVISLYAPK